MLPLLTWESVMRKPGEGVLDTWALGVVLLLTAYLTPPQLTAFTWLTELKIIRTP